MADYPSSLSKSTPSTPDSPNPSRNSRTSPNNDQLLPNRTNLKDFSVKMKARKIQLYRNGDPFFKGMTFAITDEHFRTFDSFLSAINKSAVCDSTVLQKGVRYIFTLRANLVTELSQLVDGHSYVCSSTLGFKKLDYESISTQGWLPNFRKVASRSPNGHKSSGVRGRSAGTELVPTQPKMVVVIRAGPHPRSMFRMLLNRRTATSYDQVLTHLAGALNMKTGTIRKIYSLSGEQIVDLAGFYAEDKTFVAFESDRVTREDLILRDEEKKFVESACALTSVRPTSGEGLARAGISVQQNQKRLASTRLVVDRSDPKMKSGLPQEDLAAAAASSLALDNHNQPSNLSLKPKVITVVNRGHSGENFGIPIPLLAKYKIGKVLASRNSVLVKRCHDKHKSRTLALKVIYAGQLKDSERNAIEREVDMIRRLNHPNILQLLDELVTPTETYLIMEYIKHRHSAQGDLLLNFVVDHGYNEYETSRLLLQLCSAVAHIHSLNLMHRNIRPDKILVYINHEGVHTLKLGDFGMAIETSEPQYQPCGVAAFMAPEMLAQTGYGAKVDTWSCGVIMYILLCGHAPFGRLDSDLMTVLHKITSRPIAFPSPQWDCVSDSGKDLLMFMLEVDMSTRGSASELTDHPWLSNPSQDIRTAELHPTTRDRIKELISYFPRNVDPCTSILATTTLDHGQSFTRIDEKGEAAALQPLSCPADAASSLSC